MKQRHTSPDESAVAKPVVRENTQLNESGKYKSTDNDDLWEHTPQHEAERIREDISENWANYHDDPPGDVLVDETPQVPNGMFGDHEDDFDIG